MPNSRRRRFSVQNEIRNQDRCKRQNSTQSSTETENLNTDQNANKGLINKSNTKLYPNSSKNTPLELVTECESTSFGVTITKKSNTTVDKDVTASSSNIDLFNIKGTTNTNKIETRRRDVKESRDGTPVKRDKPRQHRVKVRSPKRKIPTLEVQNYTDFPKQSVGVDAIDWNLENVSIIQVIESSEEEIKQSDHSIDFMCRICHGGENLSSDLGQLISACSCRGTVGRVHVKCLERWLTESGKSRCELCGIRYATRRIHRYGIARALMMWILSQNAKQLMVDSLGIMLMSPLAVLAAWLSGRTLAGLMTHQEVHVTPWPLASTFVLACMTLVCYYCWIVSAATRHALGWWIWYRSQYEVRLQLNDAEDFES